MKKYQLRAWARLLVDAKVGALDLRRRQVLRIRRRRGFLLLQILRLAGGLAEQLARPGLEQAVAAVVITKVSFVTVLLK